MRIDISGVIVPDDDAWVYDLYGIDHTSPSAVTGIISEVSPGEALDVYINSGGGDVFSGSVIYTALSEYDGPLTIHVTGIAASAASVIAMAGYSEMSPTAQLMVHNVSTSADGDYHDMDKASEILQQANRAMAAAYTRKSGMTEAEALAMMDRETWLTAEDAVRLGLIDKVAGDTGLRLAASVTDMLPGALIARLNDERQELRDYFEGEQMTKTEHDAQVAQLRAEGAELAEAGKLKEAAGIRARIEVLEDEFETARIARAEEDALLEHDVVSDMMRTETMIGGETMDKILDASSREYRDAFLKVLSGRELTKLEDEAYTYTTSTTPNVLPTTMLNEIWDVVSEQHAIVGDATRYVTGTILDIPRHTSIDSGAAAETAEGAEPDAMANTFSKLTLSGKDFAVYVEISYAQAQMAIDAFESYLINTLAASLGDALADDTVATLEDEDNGIATANIISTATAGTLAYSDVLSAFGSLKRVSSTVVYLTRYTLYTQVAALTDGAGRLIYQPSATAGISGTLLGAEVKIEDAVGDDKILIGDPKKITDNVITDILVESDKDVKTHTYVHSGYCRRECGLVDPYAFAEINISTAEG